MTGFKQSDSLKDDCTVNLKDDGVVSRTNTSIMLKDDGHNPKDDNIESTCSDPRRRNTSRRGLETPPAV